MVNIHCIVTILNCIDLGKIAKDPNDKRIAKMRERQDHYAAAKVQQGD